MILIGSFLRDTPSGMLNSVFDYASLNDGIIGWVILDVSNAPIFLVAVLGGHSVPIARVFYNFIHWLIDFGSVRTSSGVLLLVTFHESKITKPMKFISNQYRTKWELWQVAFLTM